MLKTGRMSSVQWPQICVIPKPDIFLSTSQSAAAGMLLNLEGDRKIYYFL